MKADTHKSSIVSKPWGYEYLVYETDKVALWALYISYGHSTSFHCHSKKTTGLIVLDGLCEVFFMNDVKKLSSLDKVMIRKGLFHSTKSVSENGSIVFEIETPKDKLDLIRLKDNYGREGLPYENENFHLYKNSDCLWLDDEISEYSFANCSLKFINIKSIDFFKNISSQQKVIFLKGGIMTNQSQYVACEGDILDNKSIYELTQVFVKLADDTKILIIGKNNE